MKYIILFAGAVALLAGVATAHVHPMYERKMLCAKGVKKAGLACKRGDVIHIKRDPEPNKFHISVTDASGIPVLREIDENTGFFDAEDDDEF
ncbi:hypothetical protein MBLNU13_g07608t1 [Cladosporium sp. NU13]